MGITRFVMDDFCFLLLEQSYYSRWCLVLSLSSIAGLSVAMIAELG